MLGYMTRVHIGERDGIAARGEEIDTFVLIPDVDRFCAQPVAIRMKWSKSGSSQRVSAIENSFGFAKGEHNDRPASTTFTASYVMKNAEVYPAEQRAVTLWFVP
jgi:hypothetical protein